MTLVTQTTLPKAHSVRDADETPPSFPQYALKVAMDLFEPEPTPTVRANGILRKCPFQTGKWVIQPAYHDSHPFIVDLRDNKIWTRAHFPATGAWNEPELLAALRKFNFHEEARWLHCQKVFTNKKDGTKYATVILDFMHDTFSHLQRREKLSLSVKQLGVRTSPEAGEVYLVPEFPVEMAEDLWAGLHVMNTDWKEGALPAPFYSGLVAKHAEAKYYMQLQDHMKKTPRWMFHPFSDPYCDKS